MTVHGGCQQHLIHLLDATTVEKLWEFRFCLSDAAVAAATRSIVELFHNFHLPEARSIKIIERERERPQQNASLSDIVEIYAQRIQNL
jgi:hypothetical protein